MSHHFSLKKALWLVVATLSMQTAGYAEAAAFQNPEGTVISRLGASLSQIKAIEIQKDGKILAAGQSNTMGRASLIVARYSADGSLDTGFGSYGVAFFGSMSTTNTMGYGMQLQPDGKILVVGDYWENTGKRSAVIARFTTQGKLDPTFGTEGFVLFNFGGATYLGGRTIHVLPDGKILAGGFAYATAGRPTSMAFAKFQSDGNPDLSFGTAGVSIPLTGSDSMLDASKVLADGKIIAVGYRRSGSYMKVMVVRLNPDGKLDDTLGEGKGYFETKLNWMSPGGGPIAVSDANDIVIASVSRTSQSYYAKNHLVLSRYHADGTQDKSFCNGGCSKQIEGLSSRAASLIQQKDGKLVAAGQIQNSTGSHFLLVRYEKDGSLDPTFGDKGVVVTPVTTRWSQIDALAISGDKIIAGGMAQVLGGNQYALARYGLDGKLDPKFGIEE